ncbi:MexE family multidrug efflux RND transporter periplasmic adaptor subunit [Steroidobacter agaridevorans]|uniref:MexE family multidrug efflux RND transporter periplasmic adaptor subunit n=1 Tax=Steroidobacter agaridevorans TaxID=2695856 RepID=A0A829YKI8_9GAMM|nr:efflux RND transporter periplasmic adaptor subunit [Steroidobacter agaridevorans]GFE83877.1 MexE family multidrug efflux RND transporter periplasmic adaptor subunit [Steroidobacter agaridevorans]
MIRPYRAPLAAALSLIGMAVLTACGKPPMGQGPAPQGTPKVSTVVVQPKPVTLTTELPGRTSAVLVADVRPQVTGILQSRKFVEGSAVKKGDLLYQIDPATYQAAVDSAEAALAKAQANQHTTRLKAERYGELKAINAVSQQDADDADAALLQANAEVASARAALETARINLAYTRVTSPISGRIGKSSVTAGALVTANQSNALATVQQLDPMYVDVTQSSNAVLQLRRAIAQGQLGDGTAKVKLVFDDGTTYPLDGKLQFSDVTVDPNTGSVTLRAEFPNPKGELLPNLYVRAIVEEGTMSQALLVPQQAVSRDATGKPHAYIVGSDGKVQQRELFTERAIGNQWLITRGLQAGDVLVVAGQQKVQPGALVEATPYQQPANDSQQLASRVAL